VSTHAAHARTRTPHPTCRTYIHIHISIYLHLLLSWDLGLSSTPRRHHTHTHTHTHAHTCTHIESGRARGRGGGHLLLSRCLDLLLGRAGVSVTFFLWGGFARRIASGCSASSKLVLGANHLSFAQIGRQFEAQHPSVCVYTYIILGWLRVVTCERKKQT